MLLEQLPKDIINIINKYVIQIEVNEKYSKVLKEINKIKYKIYKKNNLIISKRVSNDKVYNYFIVKKSIFYNYPNNILYIRKYSKYKNINKKNIFFDKIYCLQHKLYGTGINKCYLKYNLYDLINFQDLTN